MTCSRSWRLTEVWSTPRRAWMEALEERRVLSVTPTIHEGRSVTVVLPSVLKYWWIEGARAFSDGSLAILANGVVPGTSDPVLDQQALLKLTPAGTWDESFGDHGIAMLPGVADQLLFEPDGSIFAYGSAYDEDDFEGDYAFLGIDTTKITPDGKLDPTWGTNGYQRVPFDMSTTNLEYVAQLKGDHVVLSASAMDPTQYDDWANERRFRNSIELTSAGTPIARSLRTKEYIHKSRAVFRGLERSYHVMPKVAASQGITLDHVFGTQVVTGRDGTLYDSAVAMDKALSQVWTIESTLAPTGENRVDIDHFTWTHPATEMGEEFHAPFMNLVRMPDGSLLQLGANGDPILYLFYGSPRTPTAVAPPKVVEPVPPKEAPLPASPTPRKTGFAPLALAIIAPAATHVADERAGFITRSLFETHDKLW